MSALVGTLPRNLGRYELVAELARGGMASVYAGCVRSVASFERKVAIKCCHPHLRGDPDFEAMFFDEARIAAAIHHPNVVATLDAGVDGETIYQVMEFIEGARLADLVRAARVRGALPVDVCARILVDTLRGLHAAHELTAPDGTALEVVHRDVSPQNVLVGADGATRIMDFGIARALARATVTQEGVIKGKIAYMAPEQLLAQGVDRRADLFAAGVVLWEALVGARLFAGDTHAETMQHVLNAPLAPPSTRRPEAAPLDAIVMRALARDREARYASAQELADAIEAAHPLARPAIVGALVRAHQDAPAIGGTTPSHAHPSRRRIARPMDTPEAVDARPALDQDELAAHEGLVAPVVRRGPPVRAMLAMLVIVALVGGGIAWSLLTPPAPGPEPAAEAAGPSEPPVAPDTRAAPEPIVPPPIEPPAPPAVDPEATAIRPRRAGAHPPRRSRGTSSARRTPPAPHRTAGPDTEYIPDAI